MSIVKQKKQPKAFKCMWRNGVKYAFTLNFCDIFQEYSENLVRRQHSLMKNTEKLKALLSKFADVSMYPEFSTPGESYKCLNRTSKLGLSEPTGPRFHFHGVLKFHNVGDFYLKYYQKLLAFGVFEIDTIDDKKIWSEYCYKDKEVMKPHLKRYGYKWKQKVKYVKPVFPIK